MGPGRTLCCFSGRQSLTDGMIAIRSFNFLHGACTFRFLENNVSWIGWLSSFAHVWKPNWLRFGFP